MSGLDIKHEVALTRESLGTQKKTTIAQGNMNLDIIEQKWDELERENEKLTEQLERRSVQDQLTKPGPAPVVFTSPRAHTLSQQAEFIEILEQYNPNSKHDVHAAGEAMYRKFHGIFDAFNAWLVWASGAVNFAGYAELGIQWAGFSSVSQNIEPGVTAEELPDDETPPNG